jgi:CRP-like cAMP-binding protein
MDEQDRHAVLRIAATIAPLDPEAFGEVLATMHRIDLEPGEPLIRMGDREPLEYFVLAGTLKSCVGDAAGREVTLAFHVGPCTMTPAIARFALERSRIDCLALTRTRVAAFPSDALMQCMLKHPGVQRWGDAVLRSELMRRADREWALAALPAAERLLHFRREHPGLEDAIAHHHIASYLGITPVSLSRVRAQLRQRA